MGAVEAVSGWAPGPQGTLHGCCRPGGAGRGWRCWRPGRGASPVHDEGGGAEAHRGRVQRPPAAGQLAGLDRVAPYGGQPVAARLPGQQHAACLHVLLPNHRLAGGLRAVWGGAQSRGEWVSTRWGERCAFSPASTPHPTSMPRPSAPGSPPGLGEARVSENPSHPPPRADREVWTQAPLPCVHTGLRWDLGWP